MVTFAIQDELGEKVEKKGKDFMNVYTMHLFNPCS